MPHLVDSRPPLSPLHMGGGFGGSTGGYIPPPLGASYSGGAGSFGPGAFGNSRSTWGDQDDYSTGEYACALMSVLVAHLLFVSMVGFPGPAASNYAYRAPMTPAPSSPWPYPPSSAFAPPSAAFTSDFDPGHLAALRQQTMSAPPPQSFYAPQQPWAQAFQNPAFPPPTSPYDSMALSRPGSTMGMSRPATPFDYSPASTLGSISDIARYKVMPERPSEWRRDFTPKHGFEALMPRGRTRSRSFAGKSCPFHVWGTFLTGL